MSKSYTQGTDPLGFLMSGLRALGNQRHPSSRVGQTLFIPHFQPLKKHQFCFHNRPMGLPMLFMGLKGQMVSLHKNTSIYGYK